VLPRCFDDSPDADMPADDLWAYQKIGEKRTAVIGCSAISVSHELRYHPKQVIGSTSDRLYDHLGAVSWVVEIWTASTPGFHSGRTTA